ncbi:hypothetical protein GUITHDRAFT_159783 [Guillardia theta CCMP2712]|uniref:Pre-mRNA-processing factor 19 n=1 Tax=Guillardia theta (strain CCMP2712) TaxID=905079 RepID=L1J538_GUITC|nr:hypothetical protein GUITHDRAFT_159783 [Guillardia theta CCMP2712]EKX43648.1 hypothetical protein GUITHDRAFT_159783 [Guillardia theta CCMP2712]|eukprot:XP_005830628.1 hypothetical protein GUITHDRAFT_159783 [Guillardia theta CCMP2712]
MAGLVCAMSGACAMTPMVSKKTGHVFEKSTILKFLLETQSCPITGQAMSAEDLIQVKANSSVKPKPPSSTSLPSMIEMMQNEWDSQAVETHLLRKELDKVRAELSHTLYQHDAACRVIAKVLKERDEALKERDEAIAALKAGRVAVPAAAESMEVDSGPTISEAIKERMTEKSAELSKGRKKRAISPNLASEDTLKGFKEKLNKAVHKGSAPSCIDVHLENNTIVTGGMDSKVIVSDSATGKVVATMSGHTKPVRRVLFHQASDMVFSSSEVVKVWKTAQHLTDGKELCTFNNHKGEINGISLHATGDYLVSASADKSWAFYDLTTAACCQVVPDKDAAGGYSAAQLHPDGLILGTGTIDSMVKVWDIKTISNVVSFKATSGGAVGSISFSENGYYMATTGADGLKVWDLRKLAKQAMFEGNWKDARFDYSGTYLVGAGSSVKVWLAKSWNDVVELNGHGNDVVGAAFGKDASFIASCSSDKTVRMWA